MIVEVQFADIAIFESDKEDIKTLKMLRYARKIGLQVNNETNYMIVS